MIFVGEPQSPKAARYGHTWESRQAASATLHSALAACGFSTDRLIFVNLWSEPGLRDPKVPPDAGVLSRLREAQQAGMRIVALGALVARELQRHKIPHVPLRHPASRGKMRRRDLYEAHVREVLT